MKMPKLSNCGPTPPKHEIESPPRTTFQALPPEIRRMIWNYARSRCITINFCGLPHPDVFTSRSPCPVTCHINQESRAETMRHYQNFEHFFIGCKPKYVYYPFFDPAVDSVVMSFSQRKRLPLDRYPQPDYGELFAPLPYRQYFRTLQPSERGNFPQYIQIQSLHIPAGVWDWRAALEYSHCGVSIKDCTSLTEIILEGGQTGLRTEDDVRKCKEEIERGYDDTRRYLERELIPINLKTPLIEVVMPWHHSWDLLFHRYHRGIDD